MVQELPERSTAEGEQIHDPDLERHLRALGLKSIAEYQAWCARNGFSVRVDKHWQERCRERYFAAQDSIATRLARKKDEKRNPRGIIQRIFEGHFQQTELTRPDHQLIHERAASIRDAATRDAFLRLLLQAEGQTRLVAVQPVFGQFGPQPGNTFIDGLIGLARHRADWIRPLEAWRPRSHNARRQFASLARHLLTEYPVPAFMDSVWFIGPAEDAARQQRWFIAIGNGTSVRELDLAIPLTGRMAHHFLHAPDDCAVEGAIRWGQVIGLGGSVRLVRAILGSRLGTSFTDNDFWVTVIRWFIQNPMFDAAQVGPAIDFIHHERIDLREFVAGPAAAEQSVNNSVHPEFPMKGRTPAALLQRMREWHAGLRREPPKPHLEWRPSGFAPFDWTEGTPASKNVRHWTIVELRSRRELCEEGRVMRHCVASYDHSCSCGGTSIWSMGVEHNYGRRKRALTIEVTNRSKRICQIRGKVNRLPSEKELDIVRRWAAQEGLVIGDLI